MSAGLIGRRGGWEAVVEGLCVWRGSRGRARSYCGRLDCEVCVHCRVARSCDVAWADGEDEKSLRMRDGL